MCNPPWLAGSVCGCVRARKQLGWFSPPSITVAQPNTHTLNHFGRGVARWKWPSPLGAFLGILMFQYSTVQSYAVLCSTVQYYSTVQYSPVQCSTMYSTVLQGTVQYYKVQYSTVLQSTVQYSTVLQSTV